MTNRRWKPQTRAATTAFLMAVLMLSVAALGMSAHGREASALTADQCNDMTIADAAASGSRSPDNAIDNDFSTRWSDDGKGSWLRADLDSKQIVCYVDIAWYNGDGRINSFVISTSSDGDAYTDVFSGKSSGKTDSYERYNFADVEARYVKVTVNGNQWNDWASINEISVYGDDDSGTSTPSPSSDLAIDFANVNEDQVLSGTYKVVVSASDPGDIDNIKLYVDSTLVKQENADPYEFSTDTTKFSAGNHILRAVALDESGDTLTKTVTVEFENQATSPPPSSTLSIDFANVDEDQVLSGTYEVIVDASDPAEVSNIKLYVGTTLIKQENYDPYEFSTDTTKFADGSHVLKAVATDSSGDTTTETIAITIDNEEAPSPGPAPEPTTGNVALVMYASWLSIDDFENMFKGNLNGNDQIRYRVTNYPTGYDQGDVDALKAFKSTVPGLQLGISIAYSDKIAENAAKIKSQGFDFVEYNLEADFDGPNSDSQAQNNVAKIKNAADAVHEQGMEFRVTPGKPNSASFLRTGLLDDVAKLVDYYHIQAQSAQDTSDDAYADFTESISKGLRAANPDILITSQVSPGQGAQSGKTVQQTMRDVIEEAMSRSPPGNTQGAGMWIGGDDVAEAKSFFAWFKQNYP